MSPTLWIFSVKTSRQCSNKKKLQQRAWLGCSKEARSDGRNGVDHGKGQLPAGDLPRRDHRPEGCGGVLGLFEDFHVTNNSSMVSSCNMFLHFDTYITKGCRAGKLTFVWFKDRITKWWTIRWQLPSPKNKPREAIYRHNVGNNLCKMSYICTSLTFRYVYFDLSEWRSFITD